MPGERGYDFYRKVLGSPQLVVAPMVDASELAWRVLSRRYGAELCYTPMLHAHVFVKDARYRKENLATCPGDRPLIVQFCANDPDIFVAACQLAAPHCDAVDLNLGCPQAIARKGHYGAFLQEDWDLVRTMIERASTEVDIPVTAKIRVFEDKKKTVAYAQMLEAAGASMLTVHGRTREQKGPLTGLASWPHIKAVKDAVKVPVFANGNIQYFKDVKRCLTETGVDGIMSAEGNLYNPALYHDRQPPVWEMALEYLQLVIQYPCPTSYARGHVFKILHHCFCMPENFDLRFRLSKTSSAEEMVVVVEDLRDRMLPYHTGDKTWTPEPESEQAQLPFVPWICQPYVRISPEEHLKKIQDSQKRAQEKKQQQDDVASKDSEGSISTVGSEVVKRPIVEDSGEGNLSKKKKKKMARNPNKNFDVGNGNDVYEKCLCRNPKGGRCVHSMCRACCKTKCYTEGLDCPGHRILVKTKREKAAIYYGQQRALLQQQQQEEQAGSEGKDEGEQDKDEGKGEMKTTQEEESGGKETNGEVNGLVPENLENGIDGDTTKLLENSCISDRDEVTEGDSMGDVELKNEEEST